MSERAATAPRSVAEVIRGLDAPALVALLRTRPDLAQPRPGSLAELTERASTTASTQAALLQLNAWQLRVAEALAAAVEPSSGRRLAALLEAGRSELLDAVEALRRRALVWGDDRGLRITHAARSSFGSYPAGLATASPVPLSDTEIDALLRQCQPADRLLLDQLTWGPPTGRVHGATRAHTPASATNPAERLLALRLLRPLDDETVLLPREVALRLRGGRLFADQVPTLVPQWPAATPKPVAEVSAVGNAVQSLQTLTELTEELGANPPRPLATGAFARKDLVQLGSTVAPDQPVGFFLELALALGLIARTPLAWLPTARFDAWSEHPAVERWRSMVGAWIDLPGWPLAKRSAVGSTEPAAVEQVRQWAIAELRAAPVGTPISVDQLVRRLTWRHPQAPAAELRTGAQHTVDEAVLLGLVTLGVRTSLWDADATPNFPEPSDQVLLQSDLTAVAPGPLALPVRRTLALLADRESAGPASVHRFSSASVRRALDAGWACEDLLEWLASHSITPMPQPLRYLVEDSARRHGRVRVRSVGALLTIEDQPTLLALLAHPQAADLGLRRVSDTVLSASAEAADVVDLLRELGQAPVAEDEHGALLTTPPGRRARPAPAPATRVLTPSVEQLHTLATALIERGDDTGEAGDFAQLLDTLSQAQSSGDWLRLTHVDDQGRRRRVQVRVMAVVGGQARLVAKGAGQFIVPISRMVRAVPAS